MRELKGAASEKAKIMAITNIVYNFAGRRQIEFIGPSKS
jgi:hypothetical protein